MYNSNEGCAYCRRPLSFGHYRFRTNNCQQCWHREHGTAPGGWDRHKFQEYCRAHADELDKHQREVATKGPRHSSST